LPFTDPRLIAKGEAREEAKMGQVEVRSGSLTIGGVTSGRRA
jgi:hypothetical protein